jgi:mutator family transposase
MDQVRARGGTQVVDTKQVFQNLVKDTLEAFLKLEMEQHLGYAKHDPEGRGSGNSRNGATPKTVRGDFGELEIETPRDRNSSFEPKVVAKRQTSVGNFGEAVVSLYARGMTTREIEQHVKEIYGVATSPQFVSRVTEELQQQIIEWQAGRWSVSIPLSLSTACVWPYAPTKAFLRNACTPCWALAFPASRKCLDYGSKKPKALVSGSRFSMISKLAACTTCSSFAAMD